MSTEVISEDRVRVIVHECIATYENQIGNVRHKENLAEFKSIRTTLDRQDGSFTTIKLIGALIAFLVMATFALLMYLGTHPSGHAAISLHEDAVISKLNNADVQ